MRASTSASARISRSRQLSARLPSQPLHLAQRLGALAFRLGRNQVGQALDRGEIELAVLEGAAGELARLGRAQGPRACRARPAWRRSPRGRRATAVRLCPRRSRCAGPGTRAPGPRRLSLGSADRARRAKAAWRGAGRGFAGEALQRLAGARPGNAHHRNRRRRAAGGEGEDGGAVGGHANDVARMRGKRNRHDCLRKVSCRPRLHVTRRTDRHGTDNPRQGQEARFAGACEGGPQDRQAQARHNHSVVA